MNDFSKNVEIFWNNCHDKDTVVSLSGCNYVETIDFLKVRDFITPGINVLEISVLPACLYGMNFKVW